MKKRIEYKKGILANLLSGFYEQVEIDRKDESHRAIFAILRKDFNKLKAKKLTMKRMCSEEKLAEEHAEWLSKVVKFISKEAFIHGYKYRSEKK